MHLTQTELTLLERGGRNPEGLAELIAGANLAQHGYIKRWFGLWYGKTIKGWWELRKHKLSKQIRSNHV